MKTIRSLLIAAVADARAAGLPVQDVAADVYQGEDDCKRPTLFLGKRVIDELKHRGVVFGEYPGGGSFFVDVDGARVRVAEAKPVVRPKLPPGFLEGIKPKARDSFGDVVDDERDAPLNRRQRRAIAAGHNRGLRKITKQEKRAEVLEAAARGRELRRVRQKLAAGLEALHVFFRDDAHGRIGPSRGRDLHADLSLFGAPFTATTVIPADHAPPPGSRPVVFRDFVVGDPPFGELRLDAKKLAAIVPQPDKCPACGCAVVIADDELHCDGDGEGCPGCGWSAELVEVGP